MAIKVAMRRRRRAAKTYFGCYGGNQVYIEDGQCREGNLVETGVGRKSEMMQVTRPAVHPAKGAARAYMMMCLVYVTRPP